MTAWNVHPSQGNFCGRMFHYPEKCLRPNSDMEVKSYFYKSVLLPTWLNIGIVEMCFGRLMLLTFARVMRGNRDNYRKNMLIQLQVNSLRIPNSKAKHFPAFARRNRLEKRFKTQHIPGKWRWSLNEHTCKARLFYLTQQAKKLAAYADYKAMKESGLQC